MKAPGNVNLSLSFQQLAELALQLPKKERQKLVSVLQDEGDENLDTKSKILNEIRDDVVALRKGTLKTRPIKDILDGI